MTSHLAQEMTQPLRLPGSGDVGILAVHGFTGSPASMRPLAQALHTATGAPVRVPLLPGHGTDLDDMASSTWEQWCSAVDRTADELRSECSQIVLIGLSMGGALCLHTAANRSDTAHIGLINPAVYVDSPFAPFAGSLAGLIERVPGIENAINKPGQDELAYPQVPLRSVGELFRGVRDVRSLLWRVHAPITYFLSGSDDVVSPRSWNSVRRGVRGPMRTVPLPMSNHVATLDYDSDKIERVLAAAIRGLQGAADGA
ncbi:carboxylesterase [Brevibacterium sp. HMSC07C04]|uniref:alpha/beta hydrolase n=1 Tax=Brevibacterium sp. HMSC07C04 TaxID=1581130 RepID=UPI0008A2CF6D|nr:alpha/beta fold hydrolase [Brevibacterium sp. HMSC07C04]